MEPPPMAAAAAEEVAVDAFLGRSASEELGERDSVVTALAEREEGREQRVRREVRAGWGLWFHARPLAVSQTTVT